ncbi:MAG TPA: ATP synthase F1 subunit delta [Rhodothermales bacterium]|nr:ATP synthase F1 subunit delta [Rhodothermales bacterium]
MTPPVARRYAKALLDEARTAGELEAVDADLAFVGETISGARELQLMLGSPIVTPDKKRRVVEALFAGQIGTRVQRFIGFLFEKGREDLLGSIAEAYRAQRDAEEGVAEAQVRVPAALEAAEEDRLREALEARTGKKLRLRITVDPSLIGGLVVRIGDTVYDGSVRYRLDALRTRMHEGAMN